MRVPFFDMAAELAPLRPEIDAAIARVLDSGVFIGGTEVAAFERELAAFVDIPHAIGVSSGTDALLAILMALGIGPGDEVVTTPFTFFATAGAAARLGARVVFADIDAATLNLDPQAAASVCSDRTRAVIPVHLFGRPAVLPTVPCPVIEDAAQSLGGAPVVGLAAAVSFFPTKNLGALGDAGGILTADPALAAQLVKLRNQGAAPKYHHVALGGNFRLDALQAAVLRVKLPRLAAAIAARRALAAGYHEAFAAAGLPPEVRLPPAHPAHTQHQFVIRTPRRDALRNHLAAAGIGTEVYYPEPLHLQPVFADLGYVRGAMPHAEQACGEVLALPIHPGVPARAAGHVAWQMAQFFR